ncbi:NACHT, LRR and PYD domains-containing protein 6 [Hydra vulgaris]|uniref:NACHT, LRR and PYD domains-containing protein 6 n=1 Tax=Hydra vulgaris TaxID=6087 RepID=UPI001F5F81BB|nr:NACHT, LRR and PYD domains-containing protein 6-like [Hydra vulgaris]XP_047131354.1 NACHT, LRR and PYD domains-containing protein 6-like [Hydra vulgaris]
MSYEQTNVQLANVVQRPLASNLISRVGYLINDKYDQFGCHLGLDVYDLRNINQNHATAQAKAVAVIEMWIESRGRQSWVELKEKLITFRCLAIVQIIEKEFPLETASIPEISFGFSANKDLSIVSAELKKFYLKYYGKISELQPLLKAPASVDLMNKFVDLCIVDAAKPQMDAVFSVERKEFLIKQMRYTPIPYSELFMNEKSVILVSGIAGIGKTWLLRKCLLDWSNDLIWKNVELVFYLECRRINQYENVSNINDLLSVFYKDIISNFNISIDTALFIIDGLDEFKYFNELSNSELKYNYPIVNVLAEIQSYKHLIAGRVYAIDQYQSIYSDQSDKLTIQIMGFNENGIMNYVENHVKEEKKGIVKATLKESPIAKAMASVPFYLSSMCKIISDSKMKSITSFLTMTDLYANIFLYFLRKHIIKNNEMIYQIMKNDTNKMYILNVCKIAYQLFVENKVIFSKEEIETFIHDFDKNESNFFGFIEKIETDLDCYYQFAHLTIMEFCASVYAYNCLSSEEIMTNKKLKSCLSMICGLSNASQNSLLKFLVNLNPSKNTNEKSVLFSILDRLSKRIISSDNCNFFFECFYESQSSFTDEINSIVDEPNKRRFNGLIYFGGLYGVDCNVGWMISIDDGKTSYATSCENYFVNFYIKSGRKLEWLIVDKNILSDEEKNLLILCSTNVRGVYFYHPINFEGWKPKDKIKVLTIWISRYLITKKYFKENFLPWIYLCEKLSLQLHDDIDFFKDICEWIDCSNIKEFEIYSSFRYRISRIEYRGKYFRNLDE